VKAIVIAVVSLASVPVAGRASLASFVRIAEASGESGQAQTAVAHTPPRTPWGEPDLQGIWDYRTITPLERPSELAGKEVFTEEEAAALEERTAKARVDDRYYWDRGTKVVGDRRTSLIVDPPDGRIPPLTPEGRTRAAAGRVQGTDGAEQRSLTERCITRTLPRLPDLYNNNYLIVQTPGYVVILMEMIHDARIIPLDGRPHLAQHIRQWHGDSRGRWDGNTLVVDTTNFTDKTNFRGSAENLHLVERFTRVDADTINYEFTIDDPSTFTRPWTAAIPLTKTEGLIYEYACHEGNDGLADILSVTRAVENAAEEAAKKGSK
jgi:hypothetical protein